MIYDFILRELGRDIRESCDVKGRVLSFGEGFFDLHARAELYRVRLLAMMM